MTGNWEGSDRKSRLPDNWDSQIRPAALVRCGGRCEKLLPSGVRCPRRAVEVDHKVAGDDHRPSNLQGLCQRHHAVKSAREGNAAQRPVGTKKRPPEDHPGLRG